MISVMRFSTSVLSPGEQTQPVIKLYEPGENTTTPWTHTKTKLFLKNQMNYSWEEFPAPTVHPTLTFKKQDLLFFFLLDPNSVTAEGSVLQQ